MLERVLGLHGSQEQACWGRGPCSCGRIRPQAWPVQQPLPDHGLHGHLCPLWCRRGGHGAIAGCQDTRDRVRPASSTFRSTRKTVLGTPPAALTVSVRLEVQAGSARGFPGETGKENSLEESGALPHCLPGASPSPGLAGAVAGKPPFVLRAPLAGTSEDLWLLPEKAAAYHRPGCSPCHLERPGAAEG